MEDTQELTDGLVGLPADATDDNIAVNENEKISNIVRARLARQAQKHQKELDDIRNAHLKEQARAEELQKKLEEMSGQQMIPVSAIPIIQQQFEEEKNKKDKMSGLSQKIGEAVKDDKEFGELIQDKGGLFTEADLVAMGSMDYIKNMPAVIKSILKDPKNYDLFKTGSDYNKKELIAKLSERIDEKNRPQSSEYNPLPKATGTTSGAKAGFSKYVLSKR